MPRDVTVRLATATVRPPELSRPWPIHWDVTFRQLVRLCRWAEVVHMNGFRASVVIAARIAGCPVVWTHHDYSFCPTGLGWWRGEDRSIALGQCWACLRDRGFSRRSAAYRLAATLVRRVAAYQVTEHATATQYMKDRLQLATATVVPLGTPPWIGSASRQAESACHAITLVYFGRLIREKGVDVALRAIALVRLRGLDVRLDVIGDGPDRMSLERLAHDVLPPEAVSFLGQLEPDRTLERVRTADAAIVPSTWSEPAGYSVLEAMAIGVPVIASNSGGIPEVAAGAALLVERNSPGSLADAVGILAESATVRQEMSKRGRVLAQGHSAEAMATSYLALYRKARIRTGRRGTLRPTTGSER